MRAYKLLAALVLMSVIITGCSNESVSNETTEVISEESTNVIEIFGQVMANDTQKLYIDFPSRVEDILVEEGEKVVKGQALIKLNYDEYLNNIIKAKKEEELNRVELEDGVQDVEAMRAEIKNLQEQKSLKQAYLAADSSQLQTYDKQLEVIEESIRLAKKDCDDACALYEIGSASANDIEQLELKLKQLQSEK